MDLIVLLFLFWHCLDEYDGYVVATQSWLMDIYNKYYNMNAPAGSNTPLFESVSVSIAEAIYDPTQDPPHIIALDLEHSFLLDEDNTAVVMPTMEQLYGVIDEAGMMGYLL